MKADPERKDFMKEVQDQSQEKKPYAKPELVEHGPVEKLTAIMSAPSPSQMPA
jgi:hypothetical protein